MYKIKAIAITAIVGAATLIPAISANAAPSGVWTNNSARNAIIRHESSGNPYAINPSSGTTGLYQCMPSVHACPALGDVKGQHKWGEQYMKSRYGTWNNALAFWQAHNWW